MVFKLFEVPQLHGVFRRVFHLQDKTSHTHWKKIICLVFCYLWAPPVSKSVFQQRPDNVSLEYPLQIAI